MQTIHRTDPLLTSTEIVEMISDDYNNTVSPRFVRKWWNMTRHDRKEGSGGTNKLPEATTAAAVKLCSGFLKTKDGGHKRALSPRKVVPALKRRKIEISRTSVRRGLSDANLQYITRGDASRLSKKNRQGRETLCDDEEERTEEEWQYVFTDSTPCHLQYAGIFSLTLLILPNFDCEC